MVIHPKPLFVLAAARSASIISYLLLFLGLNSLTDFNLYSSKSLSICYQRKIFILSTSQRIRIDSCKASETQVFKNFPLKYLLISTKAGPSKQECWAEMISLENGEGFQVYTRQYLELNPKMLIYSSK